MLIISLGICGDGVCPLESIISALQKAKEEEKTLLLQQLAELNNATKVLREEVWPLESLERENPPRGRHRFL